MTKSIALTGFAAVLLLGIGTAQAALTNNGLSANGLTSNGLTSNGLSANGLTSNALISNALISNGLTQNGTNQNEAGSHGTTQDAAMRLHIVAVQLPAAR
jgi:hypothetical protein